MMLWIVGLVLFVGYVDVCVVECVWVFGFVVLYVVVKKSSIYARVDEAESYRSFWLFDRVWWFEV